MTPRTKDFARKVGPWVGLFIGIATLLGMARAGANAMYVRRSDYRVDRATDSLSHTYELKEIRDSLRSIGAGQTAIIDELRAQRRVR